MARFLPVSARVGAGVRRAGVDLWVVAGGSRRMRWLTASLAQSHASMGGWGGVSRDKNKIKNCAREAQAATGAARVHVLESRGERGQSKTRGPATAAAGAWRARDGEREPTRPETHEPHTDTQMVGSLRSAICLLAADVKTMGGQGGGPRRGARYHNAQRRAGARSTFHRRSVLGNL